MIYLFKKLLHHFSKTSLESTIEQNLKDFQIDQLKWMALSLNAHLFQGMNENQQLTLEDKNQKIYYRLAPQKIHFGKTSGTEYQGDLSLKAYEMCLELMDVGLLWMSTFPVPLLKNKTPEGISVVEEQKAYEWLKVSFVVLKDAMDTLLKEIDQNRPTEQLFQAQLFAGLRDDTFEWRLLLFQLDIQLIFQKDGGILCTVYNDVPHQESVGPAHKALYYAQRGPVFDLIIELINKTSLLSRAYLSKWKVSGVEGSM